MSPRTEHHRAELIDRTIEEAARRLEGKSAETVSAFIRAYYANVPPRDMVESLIDGLYGAALSHWKFAADRKPGSPKVRVYNPSLEEHGWRSQHTVIEIVNDDMPFLVDSITATLNRLDLTVHLVVHPVLRVLRDTEGRATGLADAEEGIAESFVHVEMTARPIEHLPEIRDAVLRTLDDVRAAVEDWGAMRDKLSAVVDELEHAAAGTPPDEVAEADAFLRWLHDHQFTFLGYRDYEFKSAKGKGDATLTGAPQPGLGLLRDPKIALFRDHRELPTLTDEVQAFLHRPDLLMITKSRLRSTVHRTVHMDAIGIKRFDAKGRAAGLHVFVGLFTSSAYNLSSRDIPLLRRKVQRTLDKAGFKPKSHDAKAMLNILENYPRDELLQISEDQLFDIALGILNLQERQRVALFLRPDPFERYISCLIYVPRDKYTTDLRLRMQTILERAFDGVVNVHYSLLGESALARLHIIVNTTPGKIPSYDADEIEESLVRATRTWNDRLEETLVAEHGEEHGLALYRRYRRAFRAAYRDRFDSDTAAADIAQVERALESGELQMNLHRPLEAAEDQIWFKIYHPHAQVPLSDILPMLEHMGLKVINEVPYAVRPGDGSDLVMIHDFGLQSRDASPIDMTTVRKSFHDAFARVWAGDVDSDDFNQLVLRAGLTWREVAVLRAYCRYLRQTGIAFSQTYMARTLAALPHLARNIVELFLTLFDPEVPKDKNRRVATTLRALEEGLEQVASADDDRIIRRFMNLVQCTLRTNYFQKTEDGEPKPYLAFKLDSRVIDDLPLPRPMVETFVYSPRVEAIHLRGGKVARGGIRWSDRRQDYRTEVLGLMKAQMVKNAVIVPVGAKGGFIVRRPPEGGDREAQQAEAIECYKTLMRGLLDLVDNLDGDKVVPPAGVVRRDDDDPYLVVAADKGTATFSDIANGVAAEYGFWLGDAFASGGSHGYDHKGMAITARGAWESVKRHFRELGTDIQSQDFTVVGVGDMSGDVFGNGMLLSEHIKLIAAFNHLHIFIDPDPDPAATFKERKRLFETPRSQWSDFDTALLSKGGAVYERRAKQIELTPEIKKRFGIKADNITPNDLIRTLMRTQVDLLWFGGIGTYVKASQETHAAVGDRANDALRVNAKELRCKVIGEGANLGVTQLGRVEYAAAGGRLNADSIDNSGGVDCSDHEVNIKILLDKVVADGDMTVKQRNDLLVKMTDEVAELVLRDNYWQSQALSVVQAQEVEVFDAQIRLMRMLERANRLNRDVEYLPNDETLIERATAQRGLTRPEAAVLMPYAKIWLFDELLKSDLPDDPQLATDLTRYFPTPLRKKYHAHIDRHRLNREIIATRVTNSMVNRVGGFFVTQLQEKTGHTVADIARAYTITRDAFRMRELWQAIEALDNAVPAAAQIAMLIEGNRLIERGTLWFLRNAAHPLDIGANIKAFVGGVAEVADCLPEVMPDHYLQDLKRRAETYTKQGVPEDLARRVAGLLNLVSACDVVSLAREHDRSVGETARLYFAVGARFRLGRMRAAAERLDSDTHWQKMATAALVEDLLRHQAGLAVQVLAAAKPEAKPADAISAWENTRQSVVERLDALLGEMWSAETIDYSMLAVVSRQLQGLIETPGG